MADHPNGEEEDLVIASRMSQLSSDAFDELAAQLCAQKSAPVDAALPSEDDLETVLKLSCLPADIFDEQVGTLCPQKEARPSVQDVPALFLRRISGSEVRMSHLPRASSHHQV